MNPTLETIAKRYSCRRYDGTPIEKKDLEAIALAAVQSPSALNQQPWKINVITNKALIEEMDDMGMAMMSQWEDKSTYQRFVDRGGNLFYNTPCMFLVVKEPGKDLDCGIVMENIALAACSLGLGCVICGMAAIPLQSEKGAEFKTRMGMEDGEEFGMAILIGHASKEGTQHPVNMDKIRWIE
ncbi:MAG: nitroreductase [Clostridiales bacterium]|nr:nitroreductase [Clostridiales bacterium]